MIKHLTNGCAAWHNASYSRWVGNSGIYFERGKYSIFSFADDRNSVIWLGRAVVVCGDGI